jgi:hypothetical protein
LAGHHFGGFDGGCINIQIQCNKSIYDLFLLRLDINGYKEEFYCCCFQEVGKSAAQDFRLTTSLDPAITDSNPGPNQNQQDALLCVIIKVGGGGVRVAANLVARFWCGEFS